MKPFTTLTGIAAPLPIANIDTDQIVPARFLKGVTRDGLGEALLAPLRYDREGRERPDFVLNREPWRHAQILVAGENFGCGSSREHAPWALAGFGIRAVIASSFADIFYGNALKNGLLPAIVSEEAVARLVDLTSEPGTATLTVNLEAQHVVAANGERFAFDIAAEKRDALLHGLDEISRTQRMEADIASHERRHLPDLPPIPPWQELAAWL